MDANVAAQAAAIVPKIDYLSGLIAGLNAAIGNNALIYDLHLKLNNNGVLEEIVLGDLDLVGSQACFQLAINTYQTQLNALNTQLSAL